MTLDAIGNVTAEGSTTRTQRVVISEGANRHSYLYDPHGSVSLLIDEASAVQESYGTPATGRRTQR